MEENNEENKRSKKREEDPGEKNGAIAFGREYENSVGVLSFLENERWGCAWENERPRSNL